MIVYTYSEISEITKIPLSTLYQHYRQNTGPKTVKLGRHLRVTHNDLQVWLNSTPQK
jgi:predicted DNA-binding transcriptional regulator AlpA